MERRRPMGLGLKTGLASRLDRFAQRLDPNLALAKKFETARLLDPSAPSGPESREAIPEPGRDARRISEPSLDQARRSFNTLKKKSSYKSFDSTRPTQRASPGVFERMDNFFDRKVQNFRAGLSSIDRHYTLVEGEDYGTPYGTRIFVESDRYEVREPEIKTKYYRAEQQVETRSHLFSIGVSMRRMGQVISGNRTYIASTAPIYPPHTGFAPSSFAGAPAQPNFGERPTYPQGAPPPSPEEGRDRQPAPRSGGEWRWVPQARDGEGHPRPTLDAVPTDTHSAARREDRTGSEEVYDPPPGRPLSRVPTDDELAAHLGPPPKPPSAEVAHPRSTPPSSTNPRPATFAWNGGSAVKERQVAVFRFGTTPETTGRIQEISPGALGAVFSAWQQDMVDGHAKMNRRELEATATDLGFKLDVLDAVPDSHRPVTLAQGGEKGLTATELLYVCDQIRKGSSASRPDDAQHSVFREGIAAVRRPHTIGRELMERIKDGERDASAYRANKEAYGRVLLESVLPKIGPYQQRIIASGVQQEKIDRVFSDPPQPSSASGSERTFTVCRQGDQYILLQRPDAEESGNLIDLL